MIQGSLFLFARPGIFQTPLFFSDIRPDRTVSFRSVARH